MKKKRLLILLAVAVLLVGFFIGVKMCMPSEQAGFEEKNEVFKEGLFDYLDACYMVTQNREDNMRLEGETLADFCRYLSALPLIPGEYELGKDENGMVVTGGTQRFLLVYQSGATFEFSVFRNYLSVSKTIMGFEELSKQTFAYTPVGDETLIDLVGDYFRDNER